MAKVTIIMNGNPVVVEETTPGLFGSMGYEYAKTNNKVVPPSPVPTAPSSSISTKTSSNSSSNSKQLDKSLLNKVQSNLGPGMQNDPNQVKALQEALVKAGYLTQSQMNSGPGIYGPQTTAAVSAWQKANGLPTGGNSGFFGPVSKSFIQTGNVPDANSPYISSSVPKGDNTGIVDPYYMPPGLGITEEMGNSGISNMPEDAFKTLVGRLEPGTPEYEKALEGINTAYFDVLQQQMNARTEQEQQAAEYNWNTLKSSIENNLNIKLSDNAFQAWDQVQGLKNQFAQNNIGGSGIQEEATDTYLRRMRTQDARSREASSLDIDKNQMDYYRKFATPEQIKALVETDRAKAEAWGLVPSNDIKNAMSFNALKKKYPKLSDDEINQYVSSVLDENGYYRSNLYQNYMTGSSLGTNPANVQTRYNPDGSIISSQVTPSDTGVLDINAARDKYKETTIQDKNFNEDLKMREQLSGAAGKVGEFNGIIPEPTSSTNKNKKVKEPTTPKQTTTKSSTTAIDTNYFMKPGESADAYNKRIAAYNASN